MDAISFENEFVTNLVLAFPVQHKNTKIKSVVLSTVTFKRTLFKIFCYNFIVIYF